MKHTTFFSVVIALVFSAFTVAGQDKPAAQGYLKGQESNTGQGRVMKDIEKQERETYAPKEKSAPEPKETPSSADKGERNTPMDKPGNPGRND